MAAEGNPVEAVPPPAPEGVGFAAPPPPPPRHPPPEDGGGEGSQRAHGRRADRFERTGPITQQLADRMLVGRFGAATGEPHTMPRTAAAGSGGEPDSMGGETDAAPKATSEAAAAGAAVAGRRRAPGAGAESAIQKVLRLGRRDRARAERNAWNAPRAEERTAETQACMEEWRLCDKVGEEQKKEKARRRQEEEEEEARKKPKKDEAEGKEADDGQQDQPEEDGKDGLADSQATLALGEVPGGGASGCLGGCLGDHRVTD